MLLGLLVPVRPLGFRFARAINTADYEAAVWPWLALVVTAVVFVAVASGARRSRHPPWLLAGEAVLAALMGLIMPAWSLWSPLDRLTFPVVLHPLVAALRHPFAFDPAIVRGLYWFILLLSLAWLVTVATTALRQRRRGETPPRDDDGLATVRRRLRFARVPALIALLVVATSLWVRWAEALQVLDLGALRRSWVALAAADLAFFAVAWPAAAAGTRCGCWPARALSPWPSRCWCWCPAGSGAFVFGGAEPGGGWDPLAGFVAGLGLTQGRSWFGPVLALAWVVIVADAAVGRRRGPAASRAATGQR